MALPLTTQVDISLGAVVVSIIVAVIYILWEDTILRRAENREAQKPVSKQTLERIRRDLQRTDQDH